MAVGFLSGAEVGEALDMIDLGAQSPGKGPGENRMEQGAAIMELPAARTTHTHCCAQL